MGDDIDAWFERGVTDGLPVVPPTRARVEAMLAARPRLGGTWAISTSRATVEKVASNAVGGL